MRHPTRILIVLALLFLLFLTGQLATATTGSDRPTPQQVAEQLRQQSGGRLDIVWSENTGIPRFIAGDLSAGMLSRPAKQSPAELARSFFVQYGNLYRMQVPTVDLSLARIDQDELGMQHVHFDQWVNAVPVFGGQLIVHVRENQITAVNGVYFPDLKVDTSPQVSEDAAIGLARQDIGDAEAELRADRSGLTIYVDQSQPHLTWKVNLYSQKNPGNWLYFVDAHAGRIVHKLNQLDTVKSLKVYTASNGMAIPGSTVCGAGTADANCTTTTDNDARGAFNNGGKVYDYYFSTFGRDGYDNRGSQLISTVHFWVNYHNAFWNGAQMVYGDADTYAQAFDVVAHELTHGVTQETDNLIYEHQSGALNESWSDVMAVFAGCSATTGAANCNWLMGETLTGGAVRDLSNPPAYGDPDQFSHYMWLPLEVDNGGVHTNSGIPNKAAYLLTAGDTFQGVVVAGIGYTKTEQIYYRAMANYLTTYSNFADTRPSLYSACRDLIGAFDITQSNCDQVLKAWAAVGIGSPVTPPASNPIYLPLIVNNYFFATCSPLNVLSNGNFEAGVANWVESTGSGFPLITNHLPTGFAAHDGTWLAWLGGYYDGNDILYQTINIPAGRTALQATFYVYVGSQDSPLYAHDYFYASLQLPGSVTLPEIWVVDNRDAGGWYRVNLTYNELPYVGQPLRLYFHAITDASLNTNFFLDTASVQVTCVPYTALASGKHVPVVQIERVADRPAPDGANAARHK